MSMAMPLWTGKGDVEGCIYWTKDDGEIVGVPYVRERARRALLLWRSEASIEVRKSVLEETVGSEMWMNAHAFETVGSVVRAVHGHAVMKL
jgi:hypothetical protein